MQCFRVIIIGLIIIAGNIIGQTYELRGIIIDGVIGSPLSFANIRAINTNTGTAATFNGEYILKLNSGEYTLVASYIGYNSDTLRVDLQSNLNVNFILMPSAIELGEVTVVPGVNPAIEIIEKAIKRKHERNAILTSYIFNAYTKGKILSTQEISARGTSIGIGIGKDTADLKITGILENQSKGYFLRPNYYKEEIIARKQTANFPPTINILTGGRIIQNFYSDDIQFFGRQLVGPISDNALNYYYYYIEDTLAIDNKNVFQIYFSTIDENDPGFYGRIFISAKTYDLLKIDIDLNSAANPGGLFTNVNIFQQFVPYENNIYVPIDYRLFVEGNYLGLFKFGFEINSILYDYEINPALDKNDFGMLVLKVQPEADKKDSSYWKDIQTIPSSLYEIEAYKRIDSLESIETTFWDRFSFFADRLYLNDNFYVTGIIGLYHFNNVEGHSPDFSAGFQNLFSDRFNGSLDLSYGFSDKRLKKDINLIYLLDEYRTSSVSIGIFDKTNILFNESDNYNAFTSTITSLFGKYDFRDYYRSSGFSVDYKSEIFPVLSLNLGFINRTDRSLSSKSDFSFFYGNKSYPTNTSVYDSKTNAVKFGFKFDFRKYIEDGKFRRRIGGSGSNISLGGEAMFSDPSILNSETNFQMYSLNINSRVRSFASTYFDLLLEGNISKGAVPVQIMKALPGNIESSGKNNTFRTLRVGEVFGDKIITAFFEYNLGTELWRLLNFTLLQDLQINLTAFVNAAYLDMSQSSRSIFPDDFKTFKNPFYESGFSIGHPLIPLKFEFTWKLNHRGSNNFVFGINTFVL